MGGEGASEGARARTKVLALAELHQVLRLLRHVGRVVALRAHRLPLDDDVEGVRRLALLDHVLAVVVRHLGEDVAQPLELADRERLEDVDRAERLHDRAPRRLHQDVAERAAVHRPQHAVLRRLHRRRARLRIHERELAEAPVGARGRGEGYGVWVGGEGGRWLGRRGWRGSGGARAGAAGRRVAEDLDLLAVLLDRDDVLARVDDVEPVARVALLDHRLARRDGDALHYVEGRGVRCGRCGRDVGGMWEGCGRDVGRDPSHLHHVEDHRLLAFVQVLEEEVGADGGADPLDLLLRLRHHLRLEVDVVVLRHRRGVRADRHRLALLLRQPAAHRAVLAAGAADDVEAERDRVGRAAARLARDARRFFIEFSVESPVSEYVSGLAPWRTR